MNRKNDDNVLGQSFATSVVIPSAQAATDAANACLDERIKIFDISWYVAHCTPNMAQNAILSHHISSRAPTELSENEK